MFEGGFVKDSEVAAIAIANKAKMVFLILVYLFGRMDKLACCYLTEP